MITSMVHVIKRGKNIDQPGHLWRDLFRVTSDCIWLMITVFLVNQVQSWGKNDLLGINQLVNNGFDVCLSDSVLFFKTIISFSNTLLTMLLSI